MGVIVVGYVPKPEGQAALRVALEESRRRGGQLVLVSSRRDGSEPGIPDQVLSELKDAGVDHDVVNLEDRFDAAEDLRQRCRGTRRGAHRHRAAQADPAGQAHPRQQRAAGAARRELPRARSEGRVMTHVAVTPPHDQSRRSPSSSA